MTDALDDDPAVPAATPSPATAAGPGLLRVDLVEHAGELARFWGKVVKGPGERDCWIWVGAIADDGYGRERAELHLMQYSAGRAIAFHRR